VSGCGLTFNIIDTDIMYHLDLRLRTYGYRKLIQASRLNGKWGYKTPERGSELPDLALDNDIIILVTDKHFEVTINNILITPQFDIDIDRLYNYKGIQIIQTGHCIWLDLHNSYLSNGGNFSPDILGDGSVALNDVQFFGFE
jgi:hypothetical protein